MQKHAVPALVALWLLGSAAASAYGQTPSLDVVLWALRGTESPQAVVVVRILLVCLQCVLAAFVMAPRTRAAALATLVGHAFVVGLLALWCPWTLALALGAYGGVVGLQVWWAAAFEIGVAVLAALALAQR